MTYTEACIWISMNKPKDWQGSYGEEFEQDLKQAKEMSDPNTWPDWVKNESRET